MSVSQKPNQLIHETSPYLLQHAFNPVDWHPWNEASLKKAAEEDKPIIVSVGYSSCHWCHVMERESFENESVASVMNKNFVCIKVDREERPDVDQIYMEAVQYMGISGGWPLNVFLTSDQKPFYGGTYFPQQQWLSVLTQVAQAYGEHRKQIQESAEKFAESLNVSDLKRYGMEEPVKEISVDRLRKMYDKFSANFDLQMGGMNKAPKFPMPVHWQFALKYYAATSDQSALDHVVLTLREMANGGVYDHIGGGFSRYSVDANWFVPHFEKMLYDNGQLLSLYSDAYAATKDAQFRDTVYQTVEFLSREMLSPDGGFYSALDADSEGEEGKYYGWDALEFRAILNNAFRNEEKASWIARYFNIKEGGNWENGRNILYKDFTAETFAINEGIDPTEFMATLDDAIAVLLAARNKRVKPGLDDKILAGWNGLALKGLADAFRVFGEPHFKDLALKNAGYLSSRMILEGRLLRNGKKGAGETPGFLEDYALVIQAFIELYQAVLDEKWLTIANRLAEYAVDHFYDGSEDLFFYTGNASSKLIARKKEIFDNVIPSSNSIMAENLYKLGILLDNEDYKQMAVKMMAMVSRLLFSEPQYMSAWMGLYAILTQPTREIVVAGPDAIKFRMELEKTYFPNKVVAGSTTGSSLPLLQGRLPRDNKTLIYVCYNNTCQAPVASVDEALEQMK